jgi:hypothetical protein
MAPVDSSVRLGVGSSEASDEVSMGAITKWAQGLRDRRAKRRGERPGEAGERARKRQEAKARRLEHERLDNKLPR